MAYPAYQGVQFYFDIVIGHGWQHEFSPKNRITGGPMREWEPGWSAECVIRNDGGAVLATLSTNPGADGTVTLAPGRIALDLSSTFTATLPPTTTYGQMDAKAFLWADLTLTDPLNGEPYILARGKGVTYYPTTIGA